MLIKTTKTAAANGAGNVVATVSVNGKRRQRTVRWDHARSAAWNHGNAAGVLAEAVDLGWSDKVQHDSTEDGRVHLFLWGTDALVELTKQAVGA
jgi:hypothetical protein